MAERMEQQRATGGRAAISLLRRNRDFRRLFVASVISLGGDWFLFVALGGLVLQATGQALSVGILIVAQELPIFIATPWAGWLTDRFDRRRLMIVCDVARTFICVAFVAIGPDNLWLAYVLLAGLSVFTAVLDLPTANALGGSLWGTMLAVGAALGGIVSTVFGRDTAFLVDAASFALSALLLARIRRRFSEDRRDEPHVTIRAATAETVQYARRDHRVRALISVKAGFGLAAGVLALVAVFARQVFTAGDVGFGFLMASRGLGALTGPFIGHRLAGRDHERLIPVIAAALAVFGVGYMLLGASPTLLLAGVAVFTAHLGGGAQWVLSTYGLQRIVPDRIRGRIFAFDFALITLSLAISSLVASALADAIGPRPAVMIVGGLAFAWAAAWWILTRDVRTTPIFEGCGDAPAEQRSPLTYAAD
jgi:predicted MFS family arabinose efflux permease